MLASIGAARAMAAAQQTAGLDQSLGKLDRVLGLGVNTTSDQ
jgi:hypothetical protein